VVVKDDGVALSLDVDPVGQRAQVRRAALASSIGTTIEWYDFFLYNTAAALVFPHLFFPAATPYAGAMASFATYAVGFVARPLGAAIFGHWGDRIGRKATLIVTLLVMGISSAIVGILPGTAAIGAAAPLILVLLRLVQGLAIGGEWSGSVLIAMEWGDQRKRGLLGSFAQLGVPMGLVLHSVAARRPTADRRDRDVVLVVLMGLGCVPCSRDAGRAIAQGALAGRPRGGNTSGDNLVVM